MTEEIQSSDIFANATIVGMKPMDDQSVVKDLSAFRPGLVVADAVYNPEETKLLREAKEAGCTCVGGKGMLLWQGVAAFKLYTGQDMPVEDVKKLFFSQDISVDGTKKRLNQEWEVWLGEKWIMQIGFARFQGIIREK